jgi:hypothetical protein
MYDPTVGRWSTLDPMLFQAGDANLYRYVGNDPSSETDPSGLQASNITVEHPSFQDLINEINGPRMKPILTSPPAEIVAALKRQFGSQMQVLAATSIVKGSIDVLGTIEATFLVPLRFSVKGCKDASVIQLLTKTERHFTVSGKENPVWHKDTYVLEGWHLADGHTIVDSHITGLTLWGNPVVPNYDEWVQVKIDATVFCGLWDKKPVSKVHEEYYKGNDQKEYNKLIAQDVGKVPIDALHYTIIFNLDRSGAWTLMAPGLERHGQIK